MIQILGRVSIKDLPTFIGVFSTRGAMLRKEHGSLSAELFRVSESEDEVVVLFNWESKEAFQDFLDDPIVKETMKAAGIKELPEYTFLEELADFPS